MWDYLIVTASNDAQGEAYDRQLAQRQQAGLLPDFKNVLVVTDPGGKRIGSGGSTVLCVMQVLEREKAAADPLHWEATLRRLRIMVIHAGGDSRRLPAYGPCGKVFIPLPNPATTPPAPTLFDRILPSFLALPPGRPGAGQLLVVSGDVLLQFDASQVRLDQPGLIALACLDTPEHAGKHGVFVSQGSTVLSYLQKPSPAEQAAAGAISPQGLSALDIGVMSFDASATLLMLRACDVAPMPDSSLDWSGSMKTRIYTQGMDLYREICCAPGRDATRAHYLKTVRGSGSAWDDATLNRMFDILNPMPFHVQVVPHCAFLHFGTTRQLISSGLAMAGRPDPADTILSLNNRITATGSITGSHAWIEGCRITAPLTVPGQNVVVGVDITQPLTLPPNACLDIVPGKNRAGQAVHFVRYYGIGDTFKETAAQGGTFCGQPLLRWMEAVGLSPDDTTDSLWTARVIPAVKNHEEFRNWLWMLEPGRATPEQKQAFLSADRYSAAEIAVMTDQSAFYMRRK
jgi:fucokinase